jgi:hypothetical protein
VCMRYLPFRNTTLPHWVTGYRSQTLSWERPTLISKGCSWKSCFIASFCFLQCRLLKEGNILEDKVTWWTLCVLVVPGSNTNLPTDQIFWIKEFSCLPSTPSHKYRDMTLNKATTFPFYTLFNSPIIFLFLSKFIP